MVAVLQSLHHVHRQTIMGVATGDVGAVMSPLTCHARPMTFYVKIAILYVISTHKNSILITENNMLFEMHQYDIKKYVTITWQVLL